MSKGKYESDDDYRISTGQEPVGGVYTDARGVRWVITVAPPDGGTGRITWLAKSDDDRDSGRWFSDGDRDRMLTSIDTYVDAPKGSDLGMLLLLALAAWAFLDERRR